MVIAFHRAQQITTASRNQTRFPRPPYAPGIALPSAHPWPALALGGAVADLHYRTIGFGMTLTGVLAAAGKTALLAMQIWRDDVNAKSGLLGRPVKLVYYNDQSNPPTVPAIYTKLLDVNKFQDIKPRRSSIRPKYRTGTVVAPTRAASHSLALRRIRTPQTGCSILIRHYRARPGDSRLSSSSDLGAWMAGTRPAMTA